MKLREIAIKLWKWPGFGGIVATTSMSRVLFSLDPGYPSKSRVAKIDLRMFGATKKSCLWINSITRYFFLSSLPLSFFRRTVTVTDFISYEIQKIILRSRREGQRSDFREKLERWDGTPGETHLFVGGGWDRGRNWGRCHACTELHSQCRRSCPPWKSITRKRIGLCWLVKYASSSRDNENQKLCFLTIGCYFFSGNDDNNQVPIRNFKRIILIERSWNRHRYQLYSLLAINFN